MRHGRQARYDSLSRWYDLLAGSTERTLSSAGLETLGARPGESILEIGFGTGHTLIPISLSVGDKGCVYGVDLSSGMIVQAQKRLLRAEGYGSVVLLQADALRLPFKTACFDAICMSFTLELFAVEEIPLVLAECKRLLRDHGRLCVTAMAHSPRPGLTSKLYSWMQARFPLVIDCRPIELGSVLSQTGFSDLVAKTYKLWGLPVEIAKAIKAS